HARRPSNRSSSTGSSLHPIHTSPEIHGDADSTHWQKFRRRTVDSLAGMPRASVTCSLRYLYPGTPPLASPSKPNCNEGFTFGQQPSSLIGSSPSSKLQMKAKKLSSSIRPLQTLRPYT